MERATTASIERIIAATAPKAIDAAARSKDPVVKAEAASPEAARMLHAAALDELAETKASTAKARRSMAYRVGNAVNEWKALVQAKPPEISPAVKAAIQQMDRGEEQAARVASRPRDAMRQEKTTASMVNERTPEPSRDRWRATPEPRGDEPASKTADCTSTGAGRDAAATVMPKPRPRRMEMDGTGTREPRSGETQQPTLDARPESADASPSSPRTSTPRAPAGARSSETAPTTYPMSMEDALRIEMPPTVAELEEASRTVSGWIKAVTDGEEDVDVRIAKFEAFTDDLKANVRRRQGLPPLEGDALVRTSMRLDEPPAMPTATPVAEAGPAEQIATVVTATGDHQGGATTPASAREATPVAARSNELSAIVQPEL